VQAGVVDLPLDEWWVDVPAGQAQQYLDSHVDVPGVTDAASRELLARDLQEGPLRIATQAALWLAIAAAALLAAIGFAVHTAATLSSRSAELAQLRAIGFSRWSIVRLIGVESALLATLGTVFGIVIGVLLGYLTGPLIAVSPTGQPTVPAVIVIIPWLSIVLLVIELAAMLAVVIAAVARTQKSSDPASILRAGG
jgi:predicted lysophospholipase L1 biosynthesis ABC-type transport system permease subunit